MQHVKQRTDDWFMSREDRAISSSDLATAMGFSATRELRNFRRLFRPSTKESAIYRCFAPGDFVRLGCGLVNFHRNLHCNRCGFISTRFITDYYTVEG